MCIIALSNFPRADHKRNLIIDKRLGDLSVEDHAQANPSPADDPLLTPGEGLWVYMAVAAILNP